MPASSAPALQLGGLSLNFAYYEELCRYIGFGEAQVERLQGFRPHAEPHFQQLVDDFYATVDQHPEAAARITGGAEQVQHLKETLKQWLESILTGPFDEAYVERHSRIGRVHVRINLPQQYMLTAMNRLRSGLVKLTWTLPQEVREQTQIALGQVLDLELAIMLETYRQDWELRARTNERLAAVGQLAASVGHELRNPLGTVESSLFLLGKRLTKLAVDDESVNKHRNRISEQVQTCSDAISTLLELARETPARRQTLRLRPVVEQALASLDTGPDVVLSLSIPEQLTITADPGQLRQLLTNLLSNAIHAIDSQGSITVAGNRANGGTEVWVMDSGPGIPQRLASRVFDVMFSTRPEGTGLGLALCQKIVQAHGGELKVIPCDEGASLRLWLPDAPVTGFTSEPRDSHS